MVKITELENVLNNLKTTIESKDPKTASIIMQWIKTWNMYLQWEDKFDPTKLIYYKRGDIVYANFGFNIGDEYGGVHYAVVVENDNNNTSGNVLVVPLTSLGVDEKVEELHNSEVYLGKDLIPWKPGETVAKPEQIRSISKIRIIKPKKIEDQRATIKGELLNLIDEKIISLTTKNKK